MCRKISCEIVAKLSTRSFAEELRENPALKDLDDDLCLTIHNYFKVTFDFSGKVFMMGTIVAIKNHEMTILEEVSRAVYTEMLKEASDSQTADG